MLQDLADAALGTLPDARHRAYANAFLASSNTASPVSAAGLEVHGFDLKEVYALRLALLKPIAYDLLSETLQMSRAAFEKRFGWQAPCRDVWP